MTLEKEKIDKIKELITPVISTGGLELVEINTFYQAGRLVLRILVDKKEGGITLGECGKANEIISGVLEREELILKSYILEVSSPGVDRPLKTKNDFLRVKEKMLELVLIEPIRGKKNLTARLREILDEGIRVEVEGELMEVFLSNIAHAVQKI